MKKEKKKEEKNCCEKACAVLFGLIIVAGIISLFGLLFMMAGQGNVDVAISQEVANEICMQLTGEEYVVASSDYIANGLGAGGNLVCDVFDEGSSNGIIVNR